ncbi:MAG: hypothetical protein JOZ45_08895 [Acidobacteriaceae bacterium]|nr:hypothetical protein [Acidobacteriaceae bacterium]
MPIPLPLSERRLTANRANAQWSTGPTTPEGKAKSSVNAVKTGLTGRTILLADEEEAAAYEAHVQRFQQEFQPVGDRETTLVQSLADTQWRLQSIPGLEAGLFALGRLRYAELFQEQTDPPVRRLLLDAHILMADGKHFKNLHLHESRLRRQYGQDAQELKELQAKRKQEQEEQERQERLKETASPKVRAAAGGFEFANFAEHSREQETNLNGSSKTPLTGAASTGDANRSATK